MLLKKKKVILFGSGSTGSQAYEAYKYLHEVICFSDNDETKIAQPFKSLEVIPPSEIANREFDFVIIASMFYHSIEKQLLELGIPAQKIRSFSPVLIELRTFLLGFPSNALGYIYSLAFNPVAVLGTAFASISAIFKPKSDFQFNHYEPCNGLNSVFYWNIVHNLSKHGFGGISPSMGSGNFELSKLWHFPLVSGFLYKKLAPFLPPLSFAVSMLSFILMEQDSGWLYASCVLSLGIFSYSFYSNSFLAQNYNSFGWAFLPLCLIALETNNPWLLCIASCLVATGSLTANFCLGIMIAAHAMVGLALANLLFYLPALAISLFNCVYRGNVKQRIRHIAHSINSSKETKYKRFKGMHLDLNYFHFVSLQLLFILTLVLALNELPLFSLAAVLLCIINCHLFRFADVQSLVAVTLVTSTFHTLSSGYWPVLLPYFLLINAPYCLLGQKFNKSGHALKLLKPFNLKPFLDAMRDFLAPAKDKSRILFSFEDPDGNYHALFDNQRIFLELPAYLATQRDIHLIPNWFLVAEDMQAEMPSFWGRDFPSISRNISDWKPDYLIYYAKQGSNHHDSEFEAHGFKLLSTFDWKDFPLLSESPSELPALPKWFLFRIPKKLCQSR